MLPVVLTQSDRLLLGSSMRGGDEGTKCILTSPPHVFER